MSRTRRGPTVTPSGGEAVKTRLSAARVVAAVLSGQSLAAVLPGALARLHDRQRSLLQEICYGTLRWTPRLMAVTEVLLTKPLKRKDQDILGLLLIGLYQLLYMRVPEHAAVTETVGAARRVGGRPWASGFVNGVLREFLRRRHTILEAIDTTDAYRLGHPPWMIERLREDWPDDWERVAMANNARPPMTLRVALDRVDRDRCRSALGNHGIRATPTRHSECGLTLDQAIDVDTLPGFHDGFVSVQDQAAQLAATILNPEPGMRVLDACAAPGGKTGHLLELTADSIELLAVDSDERRLQRVGETLDRLGRHATLLAADASRPADWWDEAHFDRILLDVPCSASGVIRRHSDIKLLRRPSDIAALAARQRRFLKCGWEMLAPGGRLLYVTCSVCREENESVVGRFLRHHPGASAIPLDSSWGRAAGPGRQILPGEDDMDGFYYCLIEKRAGV